MIPTKTKTRQKSTTHSSNSHPPPQHQQRQFIETVHFQRDRNNSLSPSKPIPDSSKFLPSPQSSPANSNTTSRLRLRKREEDDPLRKLGCIYNFSSHGSIRGLSCVGVDLGDVREKFFLPDAIAELEVSYTDFYRFRRLVANARKMKVGIVKITHTNLKSVQDVMELIQEDAVHDLKLRVNCIRRLEDSVFDKASALTLLDLSYNGMEDISTTALRGATRLQYLYLNNNNLHNVSLGVPIVDEKTELVEIYLQNNNITHLCNKTFRNLRQLMRLNLSSNNLGPTLVESHGLFHGCQELTVLLLQNCSITSLSKRFFEDLKSLTTLDLSENLIDNITQQTFQSLLRLENLYLVENNLQTVSSKWGLPVSIKSIHLQGNAITTIEEGALDYLPLKRIYLQGNQISTLPMRVQMYLITTGINVLAISHNPWVCDCDLLYLVDHANRSNSRHGNVKCEHPNGVKMADVDLRELNCTRSQKDCGRTSYQPTPGIESCRSCSSGSMGRERPSPVCACGKGYFTNATGDCERCPVGWYKPFSGVGSCSPCTNNQQDAMCNIAAVVNTKSTSTENIPISQGPRYTITENHETSEMFIVAACLSIVVVFTCIVIAYISVRHIRSKRRTPALQRLTRVTCMQRNSHYSPSEDYQFSSASSIDPYRCSTSGRHGIRIKEVGAMIGRGAFGQVFEASVYLYSSDKEVTKVAIKKLKETANEEERKVLRDELEQMMNVGSHPNIIGLMGSAVYQSQLCIIMEFAQLGDLLSYLKNECTSPLQYVSVGRDGLIRESNAPQMEDNEKLMMFAWQISKGMRHLEMHRFIHRDLAARNCLLTDGPVAKVSDFGLSKDAYELGHYKRVQKDRVPFKWLSPEALLWGQYSSKSDVWAFGILLWELYTFGGTPYPQVTTDQLRELHEKGYRMGRPPACPEPLYRIIRACWRQNPRQRPSFKQLEAVLDGLLLKTSQRNYLDIQSEGYPTTTNPIPLMEEDLDDQRTSLHKILSKRTTTAGLRNGPGLSCSDSTTSDEHQLITSGAYSQDSRLSDEKFPMLANVVLLPSGELQSVSVSDNSTVTSGFQSLTST